MQNGIPTKLILSTRPFQPLFRAMEWLLAQAKPLHAQIHNQLKQIPHSVDQSIWNFEKYLSISSFITGYAGLEAFGNTVHEDFAERKLKDLPNISFIKMERIKWLMKKDFMEWALAEKIFLIPFLCSGKIRPVNSYFNQDSIEWQKFRELVKIRNDFTHPTSKERILNFRGRNDKIIYVGDEDEINYWPITKLPKDITIFNYECAVESRDIIVYVKDKICEFLNDKIDDKYFSEEKAHIN